MTARISRQSGATSRRLPLLRMSSVCGIRELLLSKHARQLLALVWRQLLNRQKGELQQQSTALLRMSARQRHTYQTCNASWPSERLSSGTSLSGDTTAPHAMIAAVVPLVAVADVVVAVALARPGADAGAPVISTSTSRTLRARHSWSSVKRQCRASGRVSLENRLAPMKQWRECARTTLRSNGYSWRRMKPHGRKWSSFLSCQIVHLPVVFCVW